MSADAPLGMREMHECPTCLSLWVSPNAARACCSLEWDGKGWD
jgi:hypothetical protein